MSIIFSTSSKILYMLNERIIRHTINNLICEQRVMKILFNAAETMLNNGCAFVKVYKPLSRKLFHP